MNTRVHMNYKTDYYKNVKQQIKEYTGWPTRLSLIEDILHIDMQTIIQQLTSEKQELSVSN